MANFIVTIDGPAASGKSTVARLLAERLGASFLDTGAMYRAVTLAAMQAGVDLSDEEQLLGVLQNNEFKFDIQNVKMVLRFNGVDITKQIRQPEVTANARYVASAAKVRKRLVAMQRQLAAGRDKVISEGRDQGTVAFPNADVKFFLTADAVERTKRRQAELQTKGSKAELEQLQKAIEERDKSDQSRAVGPLKQAGDAIVVDTTDLSIEEVVEKLLGCVKKRCLKKKRK
jgi:cytidylate kinase